MPKTKKQEEKKETKEQQQQSTQTQQTQPQQQTNTQPQQQIQQSQDDKLEKILVEIINVYAKVEQLNTEVQKLRKMLYWHRKTTENKNYHSSYRKTKTYKKDYKSGK